MPSRWQRIRLMVPRILITLACVALALAVAMAMGIAVVRWSHHVAAFFEIAAIVVAGLILLAVLARLVSRRGISPATILEVDLEASPEETTPSSPLGWRGTSPMKRQSLREVIETIERAAADPRVFALFARVGGSNTGLGQIQELRDAVIAFRESGKRAVAFSETFGEFSPGNGSYYLATAFDEIALQPSGDVNLTGLMARVNFLRGALDKLGIAPRWDHRHEYKTAMNSLTETDFTPAHRESLEHVVRSQFNQIVRGIAERRPNLKAEVAAVIDRGPFVAAAAHEEGLVDRLAYRDQVIAALKAQAGPAGRLLYLSSYARRTRKRPRKGDTVALIMGVGAIRRGPSGGFNPLQQGRPYLGSDTVAAAFKAAVEDKNVKAILFRVDSPGGSYVASDTIWREMVRAREAGKPVIASMGNVAGSGGYFVAMAADKIVAQPGTVTGSIGVLAGKAVTAGLRSKVGISTAELHTSSNATMWADSVDYSESEWEKVEAFLDRAYDDFTAKVATGRGLALDTVLAVAKGRIWTGDDAKSLGLVDELGGYLTALRLVRDAIGRPAEAPLRLKPFPRPPRFLDRLRPVRPESSEDVTAAALPSPAFTGDWVGLARPAAALADALGVGEKPLLLMPDLDLSL
jgi:protease IV